MQFQPPAWLPTRLGISLFPNILDCLPICCGFSSTNAKLTSINKPHLIFHCSNPQRSETKPGGVNNENYNQAFCLTLPALLFLRNTSLRSLWKIAECGGTNIKVCNHVKNHCKFIMRTNCGNRNWVPFSAVSTIRVHFLFVINCIMQFRLRPQLLVIYINLHAARSVFIDY